MIVDLDERSLVKPAALQIHDDDTTFDRPGKIGHDMTSVTRLPFGVEVNATTMAWDFPGTQDSSKDQEIANAFFLKYLCENSGKIHFYVTISWDSMKHRGSDFVNVINLISKKFRNVDDIKQYTSFIITAAPEKVNSEQIVKKIS